MNQNTFVGVDRASGDFECAFIRNGEREATHRTFTIKVTELDRMIKWIQEEKIDVIAIVLEGGFDEEGTFFYVPISGTSRFPGCNPWSRSSAVG